MCVAALLAIQMADDARRREAEEDEERRRRNSEPQTYTQSPTGCYTPSLTACGNDYYHPPVQQVQESKVEDEKDKRIKELEKELEETKRQLKQLQEADERRDRIWDNIPWDARIDAERDLVERGEIEEER